MNAWRQSGPKPIILTVVLTLGAMAVKLAPQAGAAESLYPPSSGKQNTIPLDSEESQPEASEELFPEEMDDPHSPDAGEEDTPSEVQDALPPDTHSPPLPENNSTFLRPQNACPQELEPLVIRLLQDLPTYAELVAGRGLELRSERPSPFGTVITASEPDYTPIELAENPDGDSPTDVQQVFFTTLERQYWQGKPFSLQNYHWLILAEADNGWYLSQMYSSVGSYPGEIFEAPSPPQESSDGIVGQAVTLWLRDCRAGAVFPPEGPVQDATGR
jgi:hypothetical protein